MDYKKKLQEIVDASGLSQQSLADDIGTSLVTLSNWLNGKSTPTRKVLLKKIDTLYNKYVQAEDKESTDKRVKYYGPRDLATSFYVSSVIELLEKFDENKTDYAINDILELYNVYLYIDNLVLPKDIDNDKLNEYIALKPKLLSTIRLFFNRIDENSVLEIIKDVNYDYHEDLLSLLAHHKRYEVIAPNTLLQALNSSKVAIWSILANKQIVKQYDQDIRTLILSDTENA